MRNASLKTLSPKTIEVKLGGGLLTLVREYFHGNSLNRNRKGLTVVVMAYSHEWIFKKEFLEDLNAVRLNHSTDVKKEKETRFKAIWFIKDLSDNLRPGPVNDQVKDRKEEEAEYDIRNLKVLWTACAFFHRFYVFHSFGSHDRFAVAVACLFLASKVEEKPLRLSDHVFMYFRVRKNKVLKKSDQEFKDMERDVLLAERILLQTLGFDLNITHPYQYFRQIIGRDLKGWFSDPEDSKQVLRLATTLLTDSFRSTLCLQYPPLQMASALVFMALQIMSLKPQASSSGAYGGRLSQGSGVSTAESDNSWLDFLEKDVEDSAVQDICLTLVDMYETSFLPTHLPYPPAAHAELRDGVVAQLREMGEQRKMMETDPSRASQEVSEEFKGTGPGDEAGTKRKISTSEMDAASNSAAPPGSSSKPRYTTLPPPFPSAASSGLLSTSTSVGAFLSSSALGSSSPCHDAPTPRATYRPPSRVPGNAAQGHADPAAFADAFPPPPDSPMSSSYSTFSQAQAHLASGMPAILGDSADPSQGQDDSFGADTPAGYLGDTPTYMPPPPDTPGAPQTPCSMSSTPTFASLLRPELMGQALDAQAMLHSAKKPRVEY